MTFREWLIHFRAWLFDFPWGKDGHCFVGIAGSGEHECLLCKRKHYDADDEYDDESELTEWGKGEQGE
jgi:hypothetical protein